MGQWVLLVNIFGIQFQVKILTQELQVKMRKVAMEIFHQTEQHKYNLNPNHNNTVISINQTELKRPKNYEP